MMEDLAKLTQEEEAILRLTEEIWYQIWITDLDLIEKYFKGYNEVKRWWLPNRMFSFMRRMVVGGKGFLGKIGLRF